VSAAWLPLITAAHPASGGSEATAAWLTALATLAAVFGGVIIWGARKAWRVMSRTMRFLDDYYGEPAREGVPARPGVMARLQALDQAVAEVRAETKPNGGSNLRDVVHRTARNVDGLKEDVSDIKADQAMIRQDQVLMRQRMEQLEAQRQERDSHG
jgi:hypothetical protein